MSVTTRVVVRQPARPAARVELLHDPARDIYAAALLDSRGSIRICSRARFRGTTGHTIIQHWLSVAVKCGRPELLEWLRSSYGYGNIRGNMWSVSCANAGEFLQKTTGYVKIRHETVSLAIAFQMHMNDTVQPVDRGEQHSEWRMSEVEMREDFRRRIGESNRLELAERERNREA